MASESSCVVQLSTLFLVLYIQLCVASTKVEQPKNTSDGKNILVFMAASSHSSRISIWPLIDQLAEKGHHVTYLSPYEPKVPDPRVTDYVPKKIKELAESRKKGFDFITERKSGRNRLMWYFMASIFGMNYCEKFFTDEGAIEWIRKSKFDLVIVDSANVCAYGLAYYFKAKTITYSSFNMAPWYDAYGVGLEDSWATDITQYFPAFEPTFLSRVVAALNPLVFKLIREFKDFPKLDEIIRKGLAQLDVNNVPSVGELERNTSLIFITTNYAQEYARSFPPNVIPIGGLALTGKVKPLPKEFEDFINKGENGFIFVSFGTVMDFSKLEQHQKDMIINALLQFPDIQFIWKAAGGVGADLPENFMVSNWVPQQDLLAHPKIKAFVTHGGLGSTNEAIYNGVPMLAFPILADQDYNTNFLEPKGIGISLEISTLTTDQFKDALDRITSDLRFSKNAKTVSKLFKDRPMTPVDTAVWWTEFVLRHDTEEITEYMQSRSVHQSWWVRRQLDVWLFLFIVTALMVMIPSYILYKLMRIVLGGGSGAQQKKKLKLT